jgi:hypothetical protein
VPIKKQTEQIQTDQFKKNQFKKNVDEEINSVQ